MKLKELASLVSAKIIGDENLEITGIAPIAEAKEGELAFVLEKKYLAAAGSSKASALVAPPCSKLAGKALLLVEQPRHAMAKILQVFAPAKKIKPGVHQTAIVPKSCLLGKNISIGAYVVIEENVTIGDESVIYPHVFIGHDCQIGKNVIIHSGAKVGIDGFGYVQEGKEHVKIPQIGNVIIEDKVEIYANVCLSRATLGSTIIGEGTKIDNLSHVAHNCKIGKNCAIVSLVGFAGSVTLKDSVYVAGQAGFNGHITIGENTVVMAKSGVTKDIPANMVVSGFPAQDHKKEIEEKATLKRLAKKNK
ncbi:MAG: UDP-3-O-(3-hydroxymyristoyl)glucosamine N-acyltransferase [bacterium]